MIKLLKKVIFFVDYQERVNDKKIKHCLEIVIGGLKNLFYKT